MYFWYNLFSDLKFVKGLFDTLISNINRVVVTFENTSQEFYFYMKILHTRPDFEKPEQKCVNLTYLVGIRNKTNKSQLVNTPLNVALRKMEVTNRLFCQVILTYKNEKLLESSVSKVNFILLSLKFM